MNSVSKNSFLLLTLTSVLVGLSAHAQTHPPLGQRAAYNGVEVGNEYSGTPSTAPLTSPPVQISVPGSGYIGSSFIMSPVADPANGNLLYGISADTSTQAQNPGLNLLSSADAGKTWTILNTLGTDYYDVYADIMTMRIAVSSNGNEIFLTTSKGIFLSTDHGSSFKRLANAALEPATDVKLSRDQNTLAISYNGAIDIEIFERTNAGVTGGWAKSHAQPDSLNGYIRSKIPTDPDCEGNEGCLYGNSPIFSLQLDPLAKGVLYAGMGRGVYRYIPGQGWSILGKGVWNDSTIYNVDIVSQTGALFMSACNGIYSGLVTQTDGTSVPTANVTLKKSQSNSFVDQASGQISPAYLRTFDIEVRDSNPSEMVAASSSGVYLSRDSGVTWKRVTGGALPDKDSNHVYVEFRSAIWLPDGSVQVSGMNGTYQFTP